MRVGITTTISITLIAYAISLIIGLIVGLGRVSSQRDREEPVNFLY